MNWWARNHESIKTSATSAAVVALLALIWLVALFNWPPALNTSRDMKVATVTLWVLLWLALSVIATIRSGIPLAARILMWLLALPLSLLALLVAAMAYMPF